jgi:hypothetical protein
MLIPIKETLLFHGGNTGSNPVGDAIKSGTYAKPDSLNLLETATVCYGNSTAARP